MNTLFTRQIGLLNSLSRLLVLLILLGLAACGGKSDQDYFISAKQNLNTGDVRAAILDLKNVLKQNPGHLEARGLLGDTYLNLNDGVSSQKEYEKLVELGYSSKDVAIRLARSYSLQQKYKEILEILQQFEPSSADDELWFYTLLGEANTGIKEPQKAKKAFSIAIAKNSDFIPAQLGLARLYAAGDNLNKADETVNHLYQKHPDNVDVLLLKGGVAYSLNKHHESVSIFQKALTLEKQQAIPARSFYISMRLASSLIAAKQLSESKQVIQSMLSSQKENPLPYYLMALAAYKGGEMELATDNLKTVLKMAPNHEPSKLLLGAVNFKEGHLEQADMYLSSILEASPENLRARKLLGATQLKLNRLAETESLLGPALQQSPQDTELLELMSGLSMKKGERKEAVSYLKKAISENPESTTLRNRLATTYMEFGDLDKAVNELEGIVKSKEQNFQSKVLLILSYSKQKNFDKALKLANVLYKENTEDVQAKHILAGVYAMRGDEEKAKEMFSEIIAKKPNYVPALVSLARIEYGQKNLEQAKLFLEKVHRIESNNLPVLMSLADLSSRQRDVKSALRWMELARSGHPRNAIVRLLLARYYLVTRNPQQALVLAKETHALLPENSLVLSLLGVTELANGDNVNALMHMKKAVEINPKYTEGHYNLSQAYLKAKDIHNARTALQKSLELQPKYLKALWALTQLEIRTGRVGDASQLIKQTKKFYPKSNVYLVMEGDLRYSEKKYRKALGLYQKAAEKENTTGLVLKQFNTLLKQNEKNKAHRLLDNWLVNKPSDVQVRTALARHYQQSGQKDMAVKHYQILVQNGEASAFVLNDFAWLLFEAGDDRAEELIKKAHDLAPKRGEITDTLGWIYLSKGKKEQALVMLRKAVQQTPNNPEIQYHYAVALSQNDNKSEARDILKTLSGKKFPSKGEAQALLRDLQ